MQTLAIVATIIMGCALLLAWYEYTRAENLQEDFDVEHQVRERLTDEKHMLQDELEYANNHLKEATRSAVEWRTSAEERGRQVDRLLDELAEYRKATVGDGTRQPEPPPEPSADELATAEEIADAMADWTDSFAPRHDPADDSIPRPPAHLGDIPPAVET